MSRTRLTFSYDQSGGCDSAYSIVLQRLRGLFSSVEMHLQIAQESILDGKVA